MVLCIVWLRLDLRPLLVAFLVRLLDFVIAWKTILLSLDPIPMLCWSLLHLLYYQGGFWLWPHLLGWVDSVGLTEVLLP